MEWLFLVGILQNSFAALVLRSTICAEILEALMKEDDIHIAYQLKQININKTSKSLWSSIKNAKKEFEVDDS